METQASSGDSTTSTASGPPRTINPVLAMQGIVNFARTIPSLVGGDAVRELEAADEYLRGTQTELRSRAEAFQCAEASVRRALESVEKERGQQQSSWLRSMMSTKNSKPTHNSNSSSSSTSNSLDRLSSLLSTLLSRWPRDEKRFTAADRASAFVREDGSLMDRCAMFVGAAAVFDAAMCAMIRANIATDSTKKRKRFVVGSESKEVDQGSGDRSSAARDGSMNDDLKGLNIVEGASDSTHDTVVASAREEMKLAKNVLDSGYNPNRASRVFRGAVVRFELVRSSSSSDAFSRRQRRALVNDLKRASTRGRATAHILENSTVEHAVLVAGKSSRRRRKVPQDKKRSGVLISKKREEDDLQDDQQDLLFSDDEEDDDDSSMFKSPSQQQQTPPTSDYFCNVSTCMFDDSRRNSSDSNTNSGFFAPCTMIGYSTNSDLHGSEDSSSRQQRRRLHRDDGEGDRYSLETRTLGRPLQSLEDVYEIGETLGKGTYGVVRMAKRLSDGACFACKTVELGASLTDAAIDRLHSEIAAMRKLDHPNICRLHDVFYDERRAHLVMDLCTGGELWHYVLRQGRNSSATDEATAARFAREMLSAIRYMHDSGVCHRDLKPQNWLFSSGEDGAPLKLIDFGLAKHFCERPKPVVPSMRKVIASDSTGELIIAAPDDATRSSSDYGDDDLVREYSRCCSSMFDDDNNDVVFGGPHIAEDNDDLLNQNNALFDEFASLPHATKEPIDHLPDLAPPQDDYLEDLLQFPPMPTLDDATLSAAHPVAAAARLLAEQQQQQQQMQQQVGVEPSLAQFWMMPVGGGGGGGEEEKNWPQMSLFAQAARSPSPTMMNLAAATTATTLEEACVFAAEEATYRERISSVARAAAERARRSKRGYLSDRVGSFYFVAPEVLRGAHDARCDLWSLGVIVYMLLSGAPPFGGKTDREILARVSRAPLAFPEKLFGTTSPEARLFVARLLDRDVDRRLTAARALKDDWIRQHARTTPAKEQRGLGSGEDPLVISARIARSARAFARLDAFSKLVVEVIAARLPHADLAGIARDFYVFDEDGDGRLSLAELYSALGGRVEKSDTAVSVEEAASLFDAADVKGDGRAISYREFVALNVCGRIPFTQERLKDAFDALDVEARGYLTPRGIKNFVGIDRCVGRGETDPEGALRQHLASTLSTTTTTMPSLEKGDRVDWDSFQLVLQQPKQLLYLQQYGLDGENVAHHDHDDAAAATVPDQDGDIPIPDSHSESHQML